MGATDSPSLLKPDTSNILSSSRTHLRFTAGVLSSPQLCFNSPDPSPPCVPEVVLKNPPVCEEKGVSVSVGV